jgi:hypothetical protein
MDNYRNPADFLGGAVLHDDGETLTLVDPLSPELIEMIRTSHHRIEVNVKFIAPDELMSIVRPEDDPL